MFQLRINRMSVAGLMESPLICDIREEASTVLGKLIGHNKMDLILLALTVSFWMSYSEISHVRRFEKRSI
jgi:hypothetical protein